MHPQPCADEYDPRKPNDYAEATQPAAVPPALSPSRVILLTNLTADTEEGLEGEIAEECGKFGRLQDLVLHSAPEQQCYAKFHSAEAAKRCREALDGRLFAGRLVHASFYNESLFDRNELGRL